MTTNSSALFPASLVAVTLYLPESVGRVELSMKVDVTGPDVAGSKGVLVMVTLSSFPVRVLPCCVQYIEVRGMLKPEMETDRVKSSLAMTPGEGD